jgi:integral membrane sensor domain MASE1
MNKHEKIIKIYGIISVISVLIAALWGEDLTSKNLSDFLWIALFAFVAYIPFLILAFVAKKYSKHGLFFSIIGLFMIAYDLYAKYDAFFVNDSSTSSIIMVIMPALLTVTALVTWVCYAIFAKIMNKKDTEVETNKNIEKIKEVEKNN